MESFSKHPKARYGRQPACKECATKYGRQYYQRNKDKWQAKEAQMRAEDPEKLRTKNREAGKRFRNTPEGKAKIKQWHNLTGRDRQWANHMENTYGCTLSMYEDMFERQKGLCAICQGEPDSKFGRLCVDHCHSTKKVRGLLCGNCNHGLGKFKDNPRLLRRAIAYLQSALDDEWEYDPTQDDEEVSSFVGDLLEKLDHGA